MVVDISVCYCVVRSSVFSVKNKFAFALGFIANFTFKVQRKFDSKVA